MSKTTRLRIASLASRIMGAGLVLAASVAAADAVTYTATVSDISNTCAVPAATPATGPMVINITGEKATLTFGTLPPATGTVNSSGKLRVQAQVETTRINFSGRVTGSGGMLIMVAEMFTGSKPTCSQSWNLTLTK